MTRVMRDGDDRDTLFLNVCVRLLSEGKIRQQEIAAIFDSGCEGLLRIKPAVGFLCNSHENW